VLHGVKHAAVSACRLELDDARAAIARRVGYEASFTHFPIVGVCPTPDGGWLLSARLPLSVATATIYAR